MAVDINITPIIREVTILVGSSGGGGVAVWGGITGTLSNQIDLALQQTAQDDLITSNSNDISTNVSGIIALSDDITIIDAQQVVQNDAIALNTAKVGITPTQTSDITTNNAKVTFPEAPNDGTQYARKNLGWEAVAGGGNETLEQTLALGNTTGDEGINVNPSTLNDILKGIYFGDGDTGIYELSDDKLIVQGGSTSIQILGGSGNIFQHGISTGFRTRVGFSSTNPTYQHRGDENTGLGFSGGDLAHLVAGGSSALDFSATALTAKRVLNLKAYTFATLPTGVTGDICYITDGASVTYRAIATGGGSENVQVFFNGTNWIYN